VSFPVFFLYKSTSTSFIIKQSIDAGSDSTTLPIAITDGEHVRHKTNVGINEASHASRQRLSRPACYEFASVYEYLRTLSIFDPSAGDLVVVGIGYPTDDVNSLLNSQSPGETSQHRRPFFSSANAVWHRMVKTPKKRRALP